MQQMYRLLTPYRCKVCGQDTLFFQTNKGTIIDYKPFVDNAISLRKLIDILQDKHVKFLRCLKCQRSYIIDWTHGWPEQLLDINLLKNFGVV